MSPHVAAAGVGYCTQYVNDSSRIWMTHDDEWCGNWRSQTEAEAEEAKRKARLGEVVEFKQPVKVRVAGGDTFLIENDDATKQ